MASVVKKLESRGVISPPKWLGSNVQYETMMGSVAYGVSDDTSDVDVYGFCIPPKTIVFPHLAGDIPGFGRQKNKFEQFQQHHIPENGHVCPHEVRSDCDGSCGGQKNYDFSIYSLVKFFQLLMDNNPNMVDSIFTPQRCVLSITTIGTMVREQRRLFLHKGSWHKYKGYAYSQLHKMSGHKRSGKRQADYEEYGFDRKFAYHVVRLLYEAEMILNEHDLDLTRHREHLKSIRRGEIKEAEIRDWASGKEADLELAYANSDLRHTPDEKAIKTLLLDCLETHYGSLQAAVVREDEAVRALRQIQEVIDANRKLLE